MTVRVPLEAEEARTLVAHLRLRGLKFTHIGNESGRDPYARRRAIRLKQQGLSKGVPDYFIILPPAPGQIDGLLLAVELKRVKGSTTSPEQKQWIDALNQIGPNVRAIVAKGAHAAIAEIEAHLGRRAA